MYFIEILNKIFTKRNEMKNATKEILSEPDEMAQIIEEEKNCEHVFVPIDKTSKIYGCIKCGKLLKK